MESERIPPQLKKDEFRFVLIEGRQKRPFEKKWQESSNYRYDDMKLVKHLENGGNYGVACGYGNLVVIDADRREVVDALSKHLPKTFTVRTGGGGLHFYYICKDLDKPIRLSQAEAGNLGDVQYKGKQVVGPGSIHPNGDEYEVEIEREIAEVRASEIKFALRKWTKDRISKGKSRKKADERDLLITDVVDTSSLKKSGDEFYGAHPIHGSDSKRPRNFWVNPKTNEWHCFRHDSGGDPLLWLAVREEVIDCAEARSGALEGEKYIETLRAADIDIGEFDWRAIAQQILEEEEIVTAEDSEQMCIYEDGVYEARGEAAVKARAQELVPGDITNHIRNEIMEYVKWENPARREEFNNPNRVDGLNASHLVNLKNGLLNPETGEVMDHTPEYLSTTQLPVEYDPDADCPYTMERFKEIFGEDQLGLVKQMMGACLLKDYRYDMFFVLLGGGANGKTTFIKILRRFLGKENVSAESMHDLQRRFSRAELYGKLANLCGDMPGQSLQDTGVLKQLSGGDLVRAERKNQDPFRFENYATMIFAANELPRSPDDTYAFHRRVAIIDFPHQFKKNPDPDNPNEKEKIPRGEILSKIEEELPGLLNFALEGLEEVVKAGEITEVETVEERAERYKRESDSIWAFADARLEEAPGEWEERSEVYREYAEFCRENGFKPVRQSQFTQILPEKITTSKCRPRTDEGRVRAWRDIKLVRGGPGGPEESFPATKQKKLKSRVYSKATPPGPPRTGRTTSSQVGEVEDLGNPACEICKEEMEIEREAEKKVNMDGKEVWACESCLKEMGYK